MEKSLSEIRWGIGENVKNEKTRMMTLGICKPRPQKLVFHLQSQQIVNFYKNPLKLGK